VVRRGYVPLVQAGWKPFEQVMNHRSFYDEIAAQEHVRPESIAFGVMRFVHVSDSRSDWLAAAEAYRYSTRVATSTRFNYAVFDNNTGRDIPAKDEPSLEEIIENCVIGTADACIEKVAREIRACRASHYVCMMNCGGLDPARVKKSLELMGREVIPEVKRRLSRKTVRVSPAA
jgi:alkanesulfonate monooxygenase SsuD/methylene tetrahydromethanopterin reductase-like flavin-dependent oxidoreductase (luciferase family)